MPTAYQTLRRILVTTAWSWQRRYGVAPPITAAVDEVDAALELLGMPESEYRDQMQGPTAVSKGSNFALRGVRYQVKANRPSGKPGSRVTQVPKVRNYDWDVLIWILYDERYEIVEAWRWSRGRYRAAFARTKRLSPDDYRRGERLV
jgi:hypothetical protein